MTAWQPIETIPLGVRVEVRTYTGIICPARVSAHYGNRVVIRRATAQYRAARVGCFRTDKSGDVAAVAWRPLAAERV